VKVPDPPPIRSYLYVPGDDPRKMEKALASEADAVVFDLEDAVALERKEDARDAVAKIVISAPPKPCFVRLNKPGSAFIEDDIHAVAGPHLTGLRLPKVESTQDVLRVAERLQGYGCGAVVWCLIESALGLEQAFEIARSHERVAGLGLGEADLSADLGVLSDEGLLYARSRIVTASRAAGLPNPVQSVYTNVKDAEGLRRSTKSGKALGFMGRSAIHPAQVPIINEVFTPTDEEVAGARELLDAFEAAAGDGSGAFALPDGRFVDEAVVRSARAKLALARRSEGGKP
jgi:citrate lyase subunit beta / citryl-CoA lyase